MLNQQFATLLGACTPIRGITHAWCTRRTGSVAGKAGALIGLLAKIRATATALVGHRNRLTTTGSTGASPTRNRDFNRRLDALDDLLLRIRVALIVRVDITARDGACNRHDDDGDGDQDADDDAEGVEELLVVVLTHGLLQVGVAIGFRLYPTRNP